MEADNNLFEFADFDELESEHIVAPRYSYWKSVWRTFSISLYIVGQRLADAADPRTHM